MNAAALTPELAQRFADLALRGIDTEYPNQPAHRLDDASSLATPRQLHPAFFGCYDWHSAVHSHWTLVRLLRLFPDLPQAAPIADALDAHLTDANLGIETAYLTSHPSFERMYGWAWTLRLTSELRAWDDPRAACWAKAMQPVAACVVELIIAYLSRLTQPNRTGVHSNTAFALAEAWDATRDQADDALCDAIHAFWRRCFAADHDWPFRIEPSGEDFFSAGLTEADLAWRVLSAGDTNFPHWWDRFAGDVRVLEPAEVSDITDGRLVHLAGLNLSRAWMMRNIAAALPDDHPLRDWLESSAQRHLDAGMTSVFTGDYAGEHWLATFAVYAMTEAGLPLQK